MEDASRISDSLAARLKDIGTQTVTGSNMNMVNLVRTLPTCKLGLGLSGLFRVPPHLWALLSVLTAISSFEYNENISQRSRSGARMTFEVYSKHWKNCMPRIAETIGTRLLSHTSVID